MQHPVVDNNGHVNDLVQEHVRNLDGFLNSCNCGTSTVFCSGRETPVEDHNNGHVNHLVQELHDKNVAV